MVSLYIGYYALQNVDGPLYTMRTLEDFLTLHPYLEASIGGYIIQDVSFMEPTMLHALKLLPIKEKVFLLASVDNIPDYVYPYCDIVHKNIDISPASLKKIELLDIMDGVKEVESKYNRSKLIYEMFPRYSYLEHKYKTFSKKWESLLC